eukprot:TRINITY_DN44573_c0_g1_i1.p1 TRINITY_DN44573_c0_g1~~TRINITY_DN44573_c0_g1_i1.p1  ORF type:complete len:134 (-),score=12.22 TRINITY_DN44573_c0_g1_i1:67-468(-)
MRPHRSLEAQHRSGYSRTTVIVRDLPCKVDCARMVAELSSLGFDGCYDEITFPRKIRKGKESCLGYGFVKFASEKSAALFIVKFDGHRFEGIDSQKAACVEYARDQRTLAASNAHGRATRHRNGRALSSSYVP